MRSTSGSRTANVSNLTRAVQAETIPLESCYSMQWRDVDAERDRRVKLYQRHVEQYGYITSDTVTYQDALEEGQRLLDEGVSAPDWELGQDGLVICSAGCGRGTSNKTGKCCACTQREVKREKVPCEKCGRLACLETALRWMDQRGEQVCGFCAKGDKIKEHCDRIRRVKAKEDEDGREGDSINGGRVEPPLEAGEFQAAPVACAG